MACVLYICTVRGDAIPRLNTNDHWCQISRMSGTAESQPNFVSSWVWQRSSGVFEILRFVRSDHTPVRKVSSLCTRRQLTIDRSCSILVHIAYTCHFRLGGMVRICNTFDGYAKQIRREGKTKSNIGQRRTSSCLCL